MGCFNSKSSDVVKQSSAQNAMHEVEFRETMERRSQQHLHQNVVPENFKKDIKNYYEIDRAIVLGTGISGSVRICVHHATKLQYALKTLEKKKIRDGENSIEEYVKLKEEITIMQDLDHPNILRLHECFENDTCIYLVLELCRGGELLDRLNEQKGAHYSEKVACGFVHTMLSAIRYCHSKGIVHRDLKLENFLFESDSADSTLKLIDFGLSKHFKSSTDMAIMKEAVGTPYYVAPEVLAGNYDARCDVWSIGVIAYMLLSGTPPFNGRKDQETLMAVKACNWKFHEKLFKHISPEAKDFISKCLTPLSGSKSRPTAEQALDHPWFKLMLNNSQQSESINQDVIARLRGFERRSGLTKICMEVVAHTLQPNQIRELRVEFQKFDKDGSGVISYDDLFKALSSTISAAEVERIFRDVDFDHTGKIYYHEFLASTISRQAITEENVKIAFEKISNHNDVITPADLKNLLGVDASWKSVEEMMEEVGLPRDAPITFIRFKKLMMDTGNLVNQQRMKRRLTFISKDEAVDIKRKSMMPRANGALLDESEVTSSFDRSSLFYPDRQRPSLLPAGSGTGATHT